MIKDITLHEVERSFLVLCRWEGIYTENEDLKSHQQPGLTQLSFLVPYDMHPSMGGSLWLMRKGGWLTFLGHPNCRGQTVNEETHSWTRRTELGLADCSVLNRLAV